jgi:TusA-related sulfurtransferase
MADRRALGEGYLEALAQRDFPRVAAYLHPQVAFRALVPAGVREASDVAGVLAWLRRWFGDADELTVLQQTSDGSLGRLALSYRFWVHKQDEWTVVEQHAFCDAPNGQIERMDLVCSGFRPVEGPERARQVRQGLAATAGSTAETSAPLPRADAVLDAPGEGCATLTPLIRARIRELESGQILEVHTDDPTAHESLQAWCRLTGHTLVAVGAGSEQGQRFLIRKES